MELKNETFLAHAASDFGTARQALVRSTVGLALGYLNARGWDADKANQIAGEIFKKASKTVFRDAGNDRKTADRHVNTACTLSAKILTQIDMAGRHDQTERQLIDDVADNLWNRGGKSVAAMKRLLDTGSAIEAPEEQGATEAEKAEAENKGIEALIESMAGVDVDAPTPVTEPIAEAGPVSQIETFDLGNMSDDMLSDLAKAVRVEMASRKRDVQAQQAA